MFKSQSLYVLFAVAGAAMAQEQSVVIIDENRSVSPQIMQWQLDVPAFSVEHQVRLSLDCRIDWPTLAGSNPWIYVWVNDTRLTDAQLLNKTNDFVLRGGIDLTWYKDIRWRVLYSPDFEAALAEDAGPYGVLEKDQPYRFIWDITPFVTPGANNTLKIEHLRVLAEPDTLVLRDVKLEVGRFVEPVRAAEEIAPAPTGPLPILAPLGHRPVDMAVRVSPSGVIDVDAGGGPMTTSTRISLPNGAWREADTDAPRRTVVRGAAATMTWNVGDVRVERTVTHQDDHVHIADKLTNAGVNLVGVMIEHHLTGDGKPQDVRLGGREQFSETGISRESMNPSVFARLGGSGVGLVAVDDIFRVHVRAGFTSAGVSLSDDRLGIEPGRSHTLEWSIYPTQGDDYWRFVNAVRRNWGSNYEIPGPFIYNSKWTGSEDVATWMRDRDMLMVCGGIAQYPDGKYAHGSGIRFAPDWVARNRAWTVKMRETAPERIPMQYFHMFCSTEPDGRNKYHDARLLDGNGKQIDYPYRYELPLYVPTLNNSYGKRGRGVWTYVDTLIHDIQVKGIYWDEMAYSVARYVYDFEWDGCSVQIDPRTHKVTRKITSVPLITQPLKIELVNYIRKEHGLMLTANTQPHTRTMNEMRIPRFVETGTYSALADAHLACPLGLGNHHQENTHAESARHVRELLKRGATYHGHYYYREPADWNFISVLYPITPVQIGPGYILGEERIHTAVPGRFSFADGSPADGYVVNGEGLRGPDDMVSEVIEDGRHQYDLRMPGDHFAVLVKRGMD